VFRLFFCLRDQHDWRLVLLAGLICFTGTTAAVLLLRQARSATRLDRVRWIAAAGVATGFGIWATHFVAMLGYDPGIVVGYRVSLTALSLAIAVLMTTLGFATVLGMRGRRGVAVAGVLLGSGIALMHYIGMSAVEFPGEFGWTASYVLASIGFAIVPTTAALGLAARFAGVRSAMAACLLLTLAILLLHFTGMAAISIVPEALGAESGPLLSPLSMGIAIGGGALCVLALCIAAALISRQARATIRANEQEFRILVQSISETAIYMLDRQGIVANWNAGAQRLKGYDASEAIGLPLERFYTPEDRAAGVPDRALATAGTAGIFTGEGWRMRRDGSRFWAHVTIEKLFDDRGTFRGFAKVTRDMTSFKEHQDRLAALASNLDAALTNMHQGLCLFDADERLVISNDRVGVIFGISHDDCPPGTTFRDVLRLGLEARAKGAVPVAILDEVHARHRACVARPDGGTLIVDFTEDCVLAISHRPTAEGGWVMTLEDITERRRAEERIAHMALHDELTGLPNRLHFNRRLDADLQAAIRGGLRLGVVAVDLDRFQDINDNHGHAAGDKVLALLGQRIDGALRDGEMVARLGGDEFAACKTYRDTAELEEFVARVEACMSAPVVFEEAMLAPGASIGVAVFPADGGAREPLFNNADLAMYRAKATVGQQVCYYQPAMDETARMRRQISNDMREAIDRDEFSLAYQVQRSVGTGEITGYEALLRWQHPRDGWISPADFIPIAEENGEILKIGEWVLRRACTEAAGWEQPWKVAVNLSPVQLLHADLVGMVTAILVETGLSPRRLELEITETAVVGDKLRALHMLRQIKALGVSISIDDFGTGYSSLDTLHSFPFDKIKIDRSFLIDSSSSEQARAIIRAVLALGRSLGVPVLAEGLETEEQLQLLRTEGCDEAQGYYFGRPQPMAGAPSEPRQAIAAA
jgi:diguanylate cyclase (GGDEF)-like protein/PAS domain S-box-containing protein